MTYWDDPWGQYLGGYWSPGSFNAEIPFAGRMLGEYTSGTTGPVYFDHPNALGSSGQGTNVLGQSSGELLFYPWGQKAVDTANGSLFQYYASLLWYDPEADGYQPPNRYYIPRHSRWLTPDPLGGDITNPQSLNLYAYVLNSPTTLVDPLGLFLPICDPILGCPEPCDPWDPSCEPPDPWPPGPMPPPNGPGGGGGGGGTGPTGGSGAPSLGNADIGTAEDLLGNGCMDPSIFTRLSILAATAVAKALNARNGETKSVSYGVGGSFGVGGLIGATGSASSVTTVDIYGNATQVTAYEIGPAFPGAGAGAVAGIQVGKANRTVPTTPQSSGGWVFESTISAGAVLGGWGGSVDMARSGTTTYTVGYGAGGWGLATSVLPVYVIVGSIPYCRGGKIW